MTNLRIVLLATTALTVTQLATQTSHAQNAPLVVAQAREELGPDGKPKPKDRPPAARPPAPPPPAAKPPTPPPAAAPPPRPTPPPPAAAPPPRPTPPRRRRPQRLRQRRHRQQRLLPQQPRHLRLPPQRHPRPAQHRRRVRADVRPEQVAPTRHLRVRHRPRPPQAPRLPQARRLLPQRRPLPVHLRQPQYRQHLRVHHRALVGQPAYRRPLERR
jgi:hypothetical protein